MELNDEQQLAVEHNGSTVVLAGPGSGKTHTLVEKICHLFRHEVAEPFAIACLTFNNDAVDEFTTRLRARGLRPGRHLFLGTVHKFCLTRVIRPYAHLVNRASLRSREVLSVEDQRSLLERALDRNGVNEDPRWLDATLTRIRKDIACNEDLSGHDERHVAVARSYEDLLEETGKIDFDAMTFEALRLIEQTPAIADLIVSRYPWIAVDEYQDLGGVLHRIVMSLHASGSKIFAVGDPDQCVYEFSGARPSTVMALTDEASFKQIRLRYNYRSGYRLIEAAETALAIQRGYEPDPQRVDLGVVDLICCPPGIEEQARAIANTTIPKLSARGVPLHEIAVLYPGKGQVLDSLREAFDEALTAYQLERESKFPTVPTVRWLQRCAGYALGDDSTNYMMLSDLATSYRMLAGEARGLWEQNELRRYATLYRSLAERDGEQLLGDWLDQTITEFELLDLLTSAGRAEDVQALRELQATIADQGKEGPTLAEFAGGGTADGKVIVTTYHSSKGRQFDIVLLPGLQETLVPRTRWSRATGRLEVTNMDEERRLFYVALTRSRKLAVLYYSASFTNRNRQNVAGRSMFIDEIADRLNLVPHPPQ